jgi:putative glutamine amidotransferase
MTTILQPPSAAHHRPLVGVLANAQMNGDLPGQTVDNKYLDALREVAGVAVVIVPACDLHGDVDGLLNVLDGLLLTGAVSNVHPSRFGATDDEARYQPFDLGRDHSAFKLIEQVLARNIPLLAICRGMQELNVCQGGTLAPAIESDADRFNHSAPEEHAGLDQRYAPAHTLNIEGGGMLAKLLGESAVEVNSLHLQAIERLGDGLRIEGRAQDGTIEAVSVPEHDFALGVQWHPEFKAADNAVSRPLFEAFGAAALQYQRGRA